MVAVTAAIEVARPAKDVFDYATDPSTSASGREAWLKAVCTAVLSREVVLEQPTFQEVENHADVVLVELELPTRVDQQTWILEVTGSGREHRVRGDGYSARRSAR